MSPTPDLWLDPIPPELHEHARTAIDRGDAIGFLRTASNENGLNLVVANGDVLRERGLYERALLHALTATRVNNHGMSIDLLRMLFNWADKAKLRACGDPLPGPGPFTVYRGVAGRGSARRIPGLSWTGSPTKAAWFAERLLLPDPAVFTVTVDADAVLAYSNARREDEYVVMLPDSVRPRRVKPERIAALRASEAAVSNDNPLGPAPRLDV